MKKKIVSMLVISVLLCNMLGLAAVQADEKGPLLAVIRTVHIPGK